MRWVLGKRVLAILVLAVLACGYFGLYVNAEDNAGSLTLAVLTKDDKLKVVGESAAESVEITIKDSSFIVVQNVSVAVASGRYEWNKSLSSFIQEETYSVTVEDSDGNNAAKEITIPAEKVEYTLSLAVLTSEKTFTVAGESTSYEVSISIKNGKFKEVANITTDVDDGRFEWNRAMEKFTPEMTYYVTVTDAEGHTASETVITPEKAYTLTVSAYTKDGELKVVGESTAKEVTICVKDINLTEVYKGSEPVNSGKYLWNQSLKKYKEDETYRIIITDKDNHTVNEQVTIPITVKSIELGEYEKKLEVGKSLSLTATVMPSGAQNQTVKYSSSDENIATVSSSGKVTGRGVGKVVVTAVSGGASADAEISVYVKTVKIASNESYLTLMPGETFQLTTLVFPSTAEQKCTYTSTNDSIIITDAEGLITAKGYGIASIIISNGDGAEIVTVVINNGTAGFGGGSLHSNSYFSVGVEHMESSHLASLICDSESKEIVLDNTDLSEIDPSALCALMNANKNLVVDKGQYVILIQGTAVANPENTFSLNIPIEYLDGELKFTVNDGQALPGKVTLNIRDEGLKTKKYLYLFNPSKNRYEIIDSYNVDDRSICLDKGGTYLLKDKKISQHQINKVVFGASGGVCTVLGAVYVVMKRKYWFY